VQVPNARHLRRTVEPDRWGRVPVRWDFVLELLTLTRRCRRQPRYGPSYGPEWLNRHFDGCGFNRVPYFVIILRRVLGGLHAAEF